MLYVVTIESECLADAERPHDAEGNAIDEVVFLVRMSREELPGLFSMLGGHFFDPQAPAVADSAAEIDRHLLAQPLRDQGHGLGEDIVRRDKPAFVRPVERSRAAMGG